VVFSLRIDLGFCVWTVILDQIKKEEFGMSKVLPGSRFFLSFLVIVIAATVAAAQSPIPSGKVSIETTSIAAGIGVSWGDGILNFKGKQVHFSVGGLTLVDFGITQATAAGEVYNLTDLSKFEGNYLAGEAGFALAGGMGGISMRNQNGVIIILRSVSQGARLQLGPAGINITLKQ
jgi:hypothetical protein